MKLLISKEFDKSLTDGTCKLATHMLSVKATHMFIASNVWESIRIEIDDSIPQGVLRRINSICDDIKVSVPVGITETTLKLLTELYPEKSGALRRVYMQGGNVKGVLTDVMWTDK